MCLSQEDYDWLNRWFTVLNNKLNTLLKENQTLALDLTAITNAVNQTVGVEQSAIVLLNQLASEIAANATNPAAINTLAANLQAQAQALANAITANQPTTTTAAPDTTTTAAPDTTTTTAPVAP